MHTTDAAKGRRAGSGINSVSPGTCGKTLGLPVVLRLHDARLAAGDKVPHDVTVAQRCAAQQHHPRALAGAQRGRAAGLQHQHLTRLQQFALHLQRALHAVNTAFLRHIGNGQQGTGFEFQGQVQRGGQGSHGRSDTEGRANQYAHRGTGQLHFGDVACGRMRKRRRILLMLGGQRRPELEAMAAAGNAAQIIGRALGMHDAPACSHPVDGAGLDALHHAGGVAVHHGSLQQIGHRGQADVGVRAHIVVVGGLRRHRAKVVKKHKGADGLALHGGQHAPHSEAAAQVMGAGGDDVPT